MNFACVRRSLFIDTETGAHDELKSSNLKDLFSSSEIIDGVEGSADTDGLYSFGHLDLEFRKSDKKSY